jgi:hypothetical protein
MSGLGWPTKRRSVSTVVANPVGVDEAASRSAIGIRLPAVG